MSSTIPQYDHAVFVQPAIQQLLTALNHKIDDIDAVGVTLGRAYTGLRVGFMSAKGICYALASRCGCKYA